MGEVFISYSRRDTAFVTGLATALAERGKQPWLDVDGIQDAEVFPAVLRVAIERADGFVFVISPAATKSPFCRQEVDHAVALGKRIVPVLHRRVPDDALPPGIRERQWVPAGDDAADRVVRALDADHDHVRRHTRLLLRAKEWEDSGRSTALLPRGDELAQAETWLASSVGRDPAPSELHAAWVAAGRAAAIRRQRTVTAGAVLFAGVAVALTVLALVSRQAAVEAEANAQSRALAARAEAQLEFDPQLSILLAREALTSAPTDEAMLAATRALDANTQRSVLPSVGRQGCTYGSRLVLLDAGRTGVVTTCDGLLVFQDLERREEVARVRLGATASALALSPDGRTLAAGSGREVVLVDATSRRVLRRISVGAVVQGLAYGPAGRRLGVALEDGVALLELQGGTLRRLDTDPDVGWGAVGFAGSQLLAGVVPVTDRRNGGLAAYDLSRDGRKRWVLRTSDDGSRRFDTASVLASRDGGTAFVGTVSSTSAEYFTATVARVDLASGELLWTVEGAPYTQVSSLAVDRDETTVAAGTGLGTAWTIDAATGAVRTTLPGQPVAVRGLAFRVGAAPLVSSSGDGQLRTWADRSTERVLRRLPSGREGVQEAISPLLLHGARDEYLVLDPATGRVQRRIARFSIDDGPVFSPDLSSYVAYVDLLRSPTELAVHDVSSGRVRRTISLPAGAVPAQVNVSPALADDGRLALVRYPQGGVQATGEVRNADGSGGVTLEPFAIRCDVAVYFSPDGAVLASRDGCGAVTFHDAATGRLMREVRIDERGQYLLWTPEGRIVTDGARGTVHVVDPRQGTAQALREHDDAINNVASSPDGRWLAAMDAEDTVSVWDARSLRLVRQHVLQTRPSNLAFSADSAALAVIDAEGFIHVWDVCDICRNAEALLEQTRRTSARALTAAERRTYGVDA